MSGVLVYLVGKGEYACFFIEDLDWLKFFKG